MLLGLDRMTLGLELDGVAGVAELVHDGRRSGRWRFRAQALRRRPRLARKVASILRRVPALEAVEIDVRSGSILVVTRGGRLPDELGLARTPAVRTPGRPRFSRVRRPAAPVEAWHALPPEAALERLGSRPSGLGGDEAARRLERFGPNRQEPERARSRLQILGGQLNAPTAILVASAVVSTMLGEWVDAGAILAVVSANTAIGYVVERKSERLLASWQEVEAGELKVMRDGELASIATEKLVPGDVVWLRAGDVVPADARVLEAHRLACDEAALTGESEPQDKSDAPVAADAPLAERSAMLYAGTTVTQGRGRALVVATGAGTEAARVRALLETSVAPQAPLARRLDALANKVAKISLVGALTAAAAGLLHRRPLGEVLRGAVALGVAALPEGLPVVSTAALVRSMARMRKAGMVVRRLSSAETLGGVTVICCDKTGTLTENRMVVETIDLGDGPRPLAAMRAQPLRLFEDRATLALAAALLNSDVAVAHKGEGRAMSGSSTEEALVRAAAAAGLDGPALRRDFPTLAMTERGPQTRYVVSLHRAPEGRQVAFVKGAPEQIAGLCDLSDAELAAIIAGNERLAGAGLRVLALAWRPAAGTTPPVRGFSYLGMVGLRDPLRRGAAAAIRAARAAGIRTVILTGDQRRTALAIAAELGVAPDDVVARVSPAEKLAVVERLRAEGEIVAMAGDGINDAPALKVADVAIAVGRRATDVARHVADVVLEESDLGAILAAVAEGRIVQDNLRRAVRFLFATNFSELMLVVAAALAGARDPLTPLQLLWINLLTDTFPALALALEPGDPSVLDRPPRPPSAPILSRRARRRVARDGGVMALASALASLAGGRAFGFGVLSGVQLEYTLRCRQPSRPMSPRYVALVGGTIALQAGALMLTPLKRLLGLGEGAAPLAGFSLGLGLPWLIGRLGGGAVIVRRGAAGGDLHPRRENPRT